MKYLDAYALARLKNMRFTLRRHLAEGHLTGRHRSLRRGFSQEFAEHRSYAPGDELKHLDWKVYARKDRFFIKEFHEEKSLKTYLVLDKSGSMGYRGAGEPKWDTACRLAMAMAYLVLGQGDAAGLVTFDTEPRAFLAPRQSVAHLELIDRQLAESAPAGETDLGRALRQAAAKLPRRSLILLISDLLGDAESVVATMRILQARRHRVLVLQVLDPVERDLDLDGTVLFEGLEAGDRLRCDVSLLREAYREAFARQQRLYEASFHRYGVSHAVVYTDRRWDTELARFLAAQEAIR